MHMTLRDFARIDLGRERSMTFTKEGTANNGPDVLERYQREVETATAARVTRSAANLHEFGAFRPAGVKWIVWFPGEKARRSRELSNLKLAPSN
jgi:hypothetical protein